MYKLIHNQAYKRNRNIRCVSIHHEDPDWQCTVCLTRGYSNYAYKRYIKRLPCGHSFHIRCIDEWLIQHVNCPLCRESAYVSSTIPHMSMYAVFLINPNYMNLDLIRT